MYAMKEVKFGANENVTQHVNDALDSDSINLDFYGAINVTSFFFI